MSSTKTRYAYLDNAAATPIDPRVKREMVETMLAYANPSSFNDMGRVARKKLDESRTTIARFLGARPNEIVFTSSGSEANNMALFGVANTYLKPAEIITTPIEHPSVLKPLRRLAKRGWRITYTRVDGEGFVDLKDLERKLNPGVALVSVIYANHEIGTIQSISKISKLIRNFRNRNFQRKSPYFHVDACQATGYLDMNVNNLGVDLLTFNGAKIYGPRGIGVLFLRTGIPMDSFILGGDQENGRRAGTENLLAIAGLAKAVLLVNKSECKKIAELRNYFLEKIGEVTPGVRINGPAFTTSFVKTSEVKKVSAVGSTESAFGQTKSAGKPTGLSRLASNINISIPNLDSENLLLELDKYGIYASAGSACTARSVEPSHALKAIGVEEKYIHGALRFSLGRQTTKKEIDYVLKVLPKVVGDLKKRYNKD